MIRFSLAFSCALLAILALTACGSDAGDATGETTEETKAARAPAPKVETGPLSLTKEGPSSFREAGRYVWVTRFGTEASPAELRNAAQALHAYFIARVEKDWPAACSHADAGAVRASSESDVDGGEQCATAVAGFGLPGEAGSTYEGSTVEAASLRAKGDRAFLLYRSAAAPYFIEMARNGNTWKVASLESTAFYP